MDWNLKELIRLQYEHEYMKLVKKEIAGKYESGGHKKELNKHNVDKKNIKR